MATSGKVAKRKLAPIPNKNTLYCSFCGKSQHEVIKLIAGPTVFICDECVELCINIVLEVTDDAKSVSAVIYFDRGMKLSMQYIMLDSIRRIIAEKYPELNVDPSGSLSRNGETSLYLSISNSNGTDFKDTAKLKSEISELASRLKLAQLEALGEKAVREEFEKKFNDLQEVTMPLILEKLRKSGFEDRYRTMCVLFLDIKGFSKFSNAQREDALNLLRSICVPVLRNQDPMHLNMWGDGIVACFTDPRIAMLCSTRMLRHLDVEGLEARIGATWGNVRISKNEATQGVDIDGEAVNLAARLEPLAEAGEVLVTPELRYHESLQTNEFSFVQVIRMLLKAVGNEKQGNSIECFRINLIRNSVGF